MAKARRRIGRIIGWLIVAGIVVTIVLVGIFAISVATTTIPKPNEVAVAQATIVYYDDGKTVLGRLGSVNRTDVVLSDVPLHVRHAVLAAEDRSFYNHGGFSVTGIGRAVLNNLRGRPAQGGSTITQQYAKNAYLTQDRTFIRKYKELVLAVKLELSTDKDQILQNYLNTIYFGRGAYGIQAAAQAYFGKNVQDLTVSEGAFLAAILNAPNGLAPENNLPGLKARWQYVIDGMVKEGWLTQSEADSLTFPEYLPVNSQNQYAGTNGYLLTSVQSALYKLGYTDNDINLRGLQVVSTYNKKVQSSIVAAVKAEGPKTGTDGLRIGMAIVRPGTGEVAGIYGGADYLQNQLNNATQARGLAGSTFKPFGLATGLEKNISLWSVWNGNSPRTINGYTLRNYGNVSWGWITLLKATEDSVNTVYVDMGVKVGINNVYNTAVAAGMPKAVPGFHPDATLVLGTASPTPVELASSYATFADQGVQSTTTFIRKVSLPSGATLYTYKAKTTKAMKPEIANGVTYALTKVISNGTGFAAQKLGRPAAGKTGTTDSNMSAWFAGYTPEYACAVMMVKEKNGVPVSLAGTGGMISVTGGSFPARMWTAAMKGALAGTPVKQFPTYVPPGPSPSPKPTATPSSTPTPTLSPTPSPTPSTEPSPSVTPTPTDTPTPSPTTVSPTPTPSAAAT